MSRKAFLLFCLTILASLAAVWAFGGRVNLTPSLPLGFYVPAPASDYISFCVGGDAERIALEHHYIGHGRCPGGGMPLLKRIIAKPGDTVTLSEAGIAVNGGLLPNTKPLLTDHKGQPLKHYPFGTYRANRSMIWVASTYDVRSFDSRYWGPIPISSVQEHLRPFAVLK